MSRPVDQAPAEVEAYWAEAMPRAHVASVAAERLAPQLVGLTMAQAQAQAQEAAGLYPGVSSRFLPPNAIVTAEGMLSRVNAVVIDDRVVSAHVG